MRSIILFLTLLFTIQGAYCQNNQMTLDSLVRLKNMNCEIYNVEIQNVENRLDSLKNVRQDIVQYFDDIIDSIKGSQGVNDGLLIQIKTKLNKDAIIYENKSSYSKELLRLQNGKEVKLIEIVNSLFYKVEYNGIIGFLQIKDTQDSGSKSNYSSPSTKYKSSSNNSKQCTGYTQDGTRCKNSTKSYGGRCHLHD